MKQSCHKLYKVMLGALFCASLMFPIVLLAQKGEMPITTSSDERMKLFLKGRDKIELAEGTASAQYFEQAIEIDPDFVPTRETAPQSSGAPRKLTGGQRIAIGAAIGGCVGLVFGEYVFGRELDMPHGPDMLLGAGIDASVGALIAWAMSPGEPAASNLRGVSVAPLLSPSRKALGVTLALK
jgi:hypothetical protein